MQNFIKETHPLFGPNAEGDHQAAEFKPHLQRFSSAHVDVLKEIASQVVNAVDDLSPRIQARFIDIKAIVKDLDNRLSELIDFPQRTELVGDLKT